MQDVSHHNEDDRVFVAFADRSAVAGKSMPVIQELVKSTVSRIRWTSCNCNPTDVLTNFTDGYTEPSLSLMGEKWSSWTFSTFMSSEGMPAPTRM